jgi:DNA-binding LacI/PurR family transcriptional regulator
MNRERTTIVDVAERAGVAKGTVSRVLNNYPNFRISEEARARVKRAVVDLNYIPHIGAASLAGKQTRIIAVVWSINSAPVELALMKRISSRLHKNGYMPFVCDMPDDLQEARSLIDDFAQRGVDGVIIAGSDVATIVKNEFYNRFRAVVVETSIPLDITGCDQVVRNQTTAFREAAEHFARSGRHHPLLVMSNQSASQDKISAFTDACDSQSLELSPNAYVISPYVPWKPIPEDIVRFLDDLLQNDLFPFDAIMCETDMIALTVMSWLRKRGLHVPEDVALIGFNNSDITPFTDPPLASVDRRIDETFNALCEMLFARLENKDHPYQKDELPMRFIWRESAGGIPPEGTTK